MREFLRKLADAGWQPHPGQRAYLLSRARFRVLACGRRWGKTDAAAADLVARIASQPRSRQIAIAPTLVQARIVFDRVVWMLAAIGLSFLPSTTPHPSIRIVEDGDKNGAVLHVLDARSGHEAKNLRGQGADHILMDEAAFMPESTITEIAMPMLAATDGRMTMISTPNGRNHFHRYYELGRREENEFWSRSGPSSENPLVDSNYLQTQRSLISENAFASEYLAEFRDTASTVFGHDFIQAALSAPRVDRGFVAVGVDWARKHDFTAAVAVRGTHAQAEVLRAKVWNRMSWSSLVERVAQFAREHRATAIVCDATGVGDSTTQQLREVLKFAPITPYTFTPANKAGVVQEVVWMLEKGRLRLPADADLIREMEAFESERTERAVRYSAGIGHDDRVCALALACRALPQGGAAPTVKGIER